MPNRGEPVASNFPEPDFLGGDIFTGLDPISTIPELEPPIQIPEGHGVTTVESTEQNAQPDEDQIINRRISIPILGSVSIVALIVGLAVMAFLAREIS